MYSGVVVRILFERRGYSLFFLFHYFSFFYYFSFFVNDTATTEIYTLSLHDALPISRVKRSIESVRDQLRLRDSIPTRLVDAKDRKSTRLNSSHLGISYAVFCLKKKKKKHYGNYSTDKKTATNTNTKRK